MDVDANIKEIFEFLDNTKNGWYASSITIAKTLVQDLKNIDKDYNIAKKKRDYFYLRGKVGVMKDIGELWSIATKSEPTKIAEKKIPEFFPGDVIKVGVRITEGKKDRIQYFDIRTR